MNDRERLAELKQLAHDVRNALNGVAVNLEVARSRANRGVDLADVAPFIETAAQQLDVASRLHKRYTDAAAHNAASADSKDDVRPADDSGRDIPSHP